MCVHLEGSTHPGADFGFSRVAAVGKQFLNAIVRSATSAADRSEFAALSARYLEDVGLTEGERSSALGYDGTPLDPWRIVASDL
jgi:hypothetical protein